MALPNITGTIIAMGYNCHVRVGNNAADAQIIALVASFNATEDFQVQEAIVLGHLGPVSLDPQGYNCSITIDGLLPAKGILDNAMQYADGGKVSIMDFIPSRAKFMDAASIEKIAYMDFYNKKAGKVLAAFEGVLISNDGISADGNGYVRSNVQARALTKTTQRDNK